MLAMIENEPETLLRYRETGKMLRYDILPEQLVRTLCQ